MDPLVSPLIAALKKTIPLEVRSASASDERLEAVLSRPDLQRCYGLLTEALGPPAKEFSKAATFEPDMQRVVGQLGGIRTDQCLFLKRSEDQRVIYAALWPWASDATRITLKVGVYELRP